jgi:lipopolysaccharide export system protein LptA
MNQRFSLLLFSLLLLGAKSNLHAQDNTSKVTIVRSDKLSIIDSSRQTVIEGNASISTGNLQIDGADKIVLDSKAQTLTVHGHFIFTFSGKIQQSIRKSNQPATLEYTIGDNTVYLK